MDFQENQAVLKVNELQNLGINTQVILEKYISQTGRDINLNELIKVSAINEGKNLKFETLDNISITVSADRAQGNFNKGE